MRGRDKEEDERERERKGEREGFYVAALWMHANHPRTLAANLAGFARFGCLKDLPEILYRFLHGPRDERKDQDDVAAAVQYRRGGPGGKSCKRRCVGGPAAAAAEAAKARREKEAEHAQAVLARYDSDEAFRNLYDGVADLFAGLLKSDLEHLRAGDTAKIVFAAKWCPSLRSSYDRATLLCEAIARRVFPRDSSPEYLAIPDKHYAYRVRNRLRREVQVPLRKVLELPEVYMSARKWDELPYARAWRPRPCASTRRRPGCASFFWCLHIPWAVRLCADDDVGMVYIVYSFCLISLQSDWCSGAEKYIGWLCLLVWQKAQHVKLIGGHLPQFLHIYIWEVNQATHRLIKAL